MKSLSAIAPVYRGHDGQSGGSKNCFGRNANTTYIHVSLRPLCHCPTVDMLASVLMTACPPRLSHVVQVPVGTMVKENGNTMADLSREGQEYVAVYGGAGGKGNRFFLSNENRAPVTTTLGEKGQERVLQLELLTMAHAGLVSARHAEKGRMVRCGRA